MSREIDLSSLSFEEAESYHRMQVISDDDFDAYCYVWRTSCVRFSVSGRYNAQRHARKHGLSMEGL